MDDTTTILMVLGFVFLAVILSETKGMLGSLGRVAIVILDIIGVLASIWFLFDLMGSIFI